MLNLSFQEAADGLYGSNAFLKSKIRSDLRILWPKNERNTVLHKKALKFRFSVKRYSNCFSAIKSLNLIGFWIFKKHLIRIDNLQPLEMIDLTFL